MLQEFFARMPWQVEIEQQEIRTGDVRVLGELVKKVEGLGSIRNDLQGVEQAMSIEHTTDEGDLRRAIFNGQNR
jgi:hypothetical protein